MLAMPEEEKECSVAAKQAFASFGKNLASFIRVKRKCRSAVLDRAGLKLEPKHLIESTCLCKGLFLEKEVERVHDLAQWDNVSLVNRWQMSSLASASGFSGSTSGQKRRFSGFTNPSRFSSQTGHASAKRHSTTTSSFKSPATNESFERRHKAQSSFQRRNDRQGDQNKPATSSQSQPRGGKSFRGHYSKGNSSHSD